MLRVNGNFAWVNGVTQNCQAILNEVNVKEMFAAAVEKEERLDN